MTIIGGLVDTLEEARTLVLAHRDEGIECPCCKQFAKVYKRKLSSAMAFVLILIAEHAKSWTHIPSLSKLNSVAFRGGDWAKLKYWDLIVERPGIRADGSNRAGHWRITEKGLAFAHGQIEVPRHVFLYDGEVQRFSEELTDIRVALGDKFSYEELMQNVRVGGQ